MPRFNPGDRVYLVRGLHEEDFDDAPILPFFSDYRQFENYVGQTEVPTGTILGTSGEIAQVFWDRQYHDDMYGVYEILGEDIVGNTTEWMVEHGIAPEDCREPRQWNIDLVFLRLLSEIAESSPPISPVLRRINKLYRKSKLPFVRAWAQ